MDLDSFAALYEAHYHSVASYLWRRTADRHFTEELAAETFLRAYRNRAQFSRRVPARNWLLGIAANTASRQLYRRALERGVVRDLGESTSGFGSPESEPHRSVDAHDELNRVRVAINRLPEGQQAALTLHCFEGLNLSEIATLLGVAQGTIKSRLNRARAELRRMLQGEGS